MEYYERLKEVREDKDLTQKDVAILIGTTQQQLYKYENGLQDMTAPKLKKLCELYGVSADYILGLPKGSNWPR